MSKIEVPVCWRRFASLNGGKSGSIIRIIESPHTHGFLRAICKFKLAHRGSAGLTNVRINDDLTTT